MSRKGSARPAAGRRFRVALGTQLPPPRTIPRVANSLIYFENPGSLNDGGLLLSFSKPSRSLPVDVNPRELLTIFIEYGYLPMAVFAAAILLQAGTLFWSNLFVFLHE